MGKKEIAIDFKKIYADIYGDYGYTEKPQTDAEKTALVVIDMQTAFIDPAIGTARAYDKMTKSGAAYFAQRVREQVIPNHQKLLRYFREKGMLVVYITTWSETEDLRDMPRYQRMIIRKREEAVGEQTYRKWNKGMGVCPEIAPQDHEQVLPKRSASAFGTSVLDYVLKNAGIETLVLTGVNTNGCVFETLVVGKNMGYDFIMPSDATACFAPVLQAEAENWISRHFALVLNTEETIELLTGRTKL